MGPCLNLFFVGTVTFYYSHLKVTAKCANPKSFHVLDTFPDILNSLSCQIYVYARPWHDAWAIACPRTITRSNQEKGGLCRR